LLKNNNITIGIATSANKENVDFIMDNTGIKGYFQEIVDADQIEKGKPSPEIYLKTADKLGYIPTKCIVVEDSISGIMSGKNANMKVIAITSTHAREELGKADLVIADFIELDDMEKINNLL
jgi:beta-phosphoglucomutase-like phosphatase (HAD superfamily)